MAFVMSVASLAVCAEEMADLSGSAAIASESGLSVVLDGSLPMLFKNQVAKASYTITSSEAPVGAKAQMYIDGVLIEGAGSEYFVLWGENKESFDFTVPSGLDPAYLHTLGIEITTDSGKKAGCYSVFSVSAKAPAIKLKFGSAPLSVTPGTDLYYRIDFSLPSGMNACVGTLRFEINGIEYPELDETVCFGNGQTFYKQIPAGYTWSDTYNYNLKVILNPGGDASFSHAQASSSVAMVNEKTRLFNEVKQKINALVIPASITKTTPAYAYSSLTGYKTTISQGTVVEYMNPDSSTSMRAAKVKTQSGSIYWVPMANIYISRENLIISDNISDIEREIFVNGMGYKSPTGYLIWVNKERQRLSVFMGNEGNWKILKTFPVATGTNLTPTPTTVCTYEYPTRWVTETYICNPVLSLYDGYAIHNQPVSHSGYVTDSTIGKPASHGCIRMLQGDVNWVYAYVPVKTTVVLY